MGTLTDEDLRHLLGEAAQGFDVPEDGPAEVRDAADAAEVVPLRRRRWVQVPAAAAVVAGAVLAGTLLAGGGDAGPPETTASGEGRALSEEQGFADGDVASGAAGGGTGSATGSSTGGDTSGEVAAEYGLADRAAPAAAAPVPAPAPQGTARLALPGAAQGSAPGTANGGAPGAAPPPAAPEPDGARVVKTGAIGLIVEEGEVTPTLTELQVLATGVGGVVASARTQESGPTPSGSVTLRVPVDSFEEVVAAVRRLDAEVRSATTSGQDVTAAYADLEAQLRTLTAARERFLAILAEARSVGDILAVQQRVDDVTGRIDRLEGQRRVLAAQTESGTLEVTVTEADDPALTKAEKPDDGLGKAFADAWDGFTSGVEGLIRVSGRAVLLLICAVLAYVVLRLGWRASRRRLV